LPPRAAALFMRTPFGTVGLLCETAGARNISASGAIVVGDICLSGSYLGDADAG
jgi:hypothetical protein